PMLIEALKGTPVDLAFVSADADDEAIEAFQKTQGMPAGDARLVRLTDLEKALQEAGFQTTASLPVHVLIGPGGGLRCVRVGAVERRHIDAILSAIGEAGGEP